MFPAGDTDKSLVPVTLAICIPTHSHVSPFLTPHLEAYFVLTPRGFSTLFATQRGTASHLMHPPHTSTAASPVCRRAFASSGFWDQQVGWPQRLEVSFLQEQPSFWTSTPFFFLFFIQISCTEMNCVSHFLVGAVALLAAFVKCRHPTQMCFIST